MTLTIELTPQDTLPSLLTRLKAAQDERILFVVPPGLKLTVIDLRVLRREATGCQVAVALVTTDPGLRDRAGQAGVKTFRSASFAARARLRPPRPDKARRARPVGSAVALPPPAPGLFVRPVPKGVRAVPLWRSFVRGHSPWWATLGLCLVLVLLLGGLVAALAMIVPAATVTIVPPSEPIELRVDLRAIADAKADPIAGIVPARGVSAQVAGDGRIATTGRRFEPSAKAVGRVTMSNRSGRTLTIPVGTVVATATGNNVRFATTAEGKLDPNGRATVPVEAVLPGLSGNARAGTITEVEGPLSLSVVVSNDSATGGGGSTQVAVVAEDDKDKLQAQLFEELKQKAYEKLTEGLAPGTFIPAESVQYLAMSPTFSPFVGDVSPELFLSMSVQAVGQAVDTTSGNEVALERLQRAMPPGSRLIASSVRYIPGSVTVQNDKEVTFNITAQGTLLRGIDAAAARTAIQGVAPEKATGMLIDRFALAVAPQISLGPDWLPLIIPTEIPAVPWRIRVLVDWDAGAARAGHNS